VVKADSVLVEDEAGKVLMTSYATGGVHTFLTGGDDDCHAAAAAVTVLYHLAGTVKGAAAAPVGAAV